MNDTDPLAPTFVAPLGERGGASPPTERYSAIEPIGRGGMGVVELCVDRLIGRDVARKTIRSEARDHADRFLREAMVQARLEHPVFVPVYDVDPSGPSFTMRRVAGRSLSEVLKARGPSDSPQRLLRVFVELCLALDYAHTRGLVHRDVKPDNIMLGEFGEVYLLDWGIAKVSGETDVIARGTGEGTQAGAMLGTLGYMSPEQLRGEQERVDARADVYALGATLYEILTGTPMHADASPGERIASTLEPGDLRPSARRADVAAELDAICLRATRSDPAERFPSARALGQAVERYLDGERDQQARVVQASEFAREARGVLDRARDAPGRIDAGRRASRALALDPRNADAREVLVAALMNADAEPTPEARAAAETLRRSAEARSVADYGKMLVGFAPLALLAFWLAGIRDGAVVAAFLATTLAAGVVFARVRVEPRQEAWILFGFGLLSVSNAFGTRMASPWVTVPMAMVGNLVILGLHARPAQRTALGAMTLATVFVPMALDELRLIPPSYELIAGDLVIHPLIIDFRIWLMAGYLVMLVITGGRVLWRVLDDLRQVEVRVQSVAWTIREIATPSDEASASGPERAEGPHP